MAIKSSKNKDIKEVKIIEEPVSMPPELQEDSLVSMTKTELADFAKTVKEDVLQELNQTNKATPESDNYLKKILETMVDTNYTGGAREMMGPVSLENIDQDDFLETPATFFSYSFTFTVFGDKRFGRDVKTPYSKPIRFEHTFRTTKKGTSRYDKTTLSLCTAKIYSKKEVEWIRNHTLYGIKFYENIGEVQDIDVQLANKMVAVNNMLNSMTQHEVIARAKLEGITISNNLDQTRKALTVKMAHGELTALKTKTKADVQSMMSPLEIENEVSNIANKTAY
tara:strand:+ start:307 stop:1149 length:843 start_codon:yes stop_codon:yes gene_type:complete